MAKFSLAILTGTVLLLTSVTGLNIDIYDPNRVDVEIPFISDQVKAEAVEVGRRARQQIKDHEKYLVDNGIIMSPDQPGYLNSATKKLSSGTYDIAEAGDVAVYASLDLAERVELSLEQIKYGAIPILNDTTDICAEPPTCDASLKYRSIDGSCNNLNNPRWGQAKTPFLRLISADYADGLNSPRTSLSGSPLPSARIVSSRGTDSLDRPERRLTHILMQWGQFLDHDITLTPIVTGAEHDITCCLNGTIRPTSDLHEGCLPIEVPETDSFFSPKGVTCMEFIRSAPVSSATCTFSTREQMNINSAYIDASNVYGSDDERAEDLREHVGGRLRVFTQGERELLPPDDAPEEDCHNTIHDCFKAGDIRVNEQPDLAVMHTIWMREHNRIAQKLAEYNPHWDDETLYQESRRIVGAEMQHITYNEWLPKILGRNFMAENGLTPEHPGHAYNDCIDGSISNAFATAAFRFGHSLIQQFLEGYDSSFNMDRNVQLGDVFFQGDFLYEPETIDSLLRGLTRQNCQKFDRNINPELTTKLYSGPADFGLDLIALNIQRGREHGIPPYLAYREACGLSVPQTFSDLEDLVGRKNMKMLSNTYASLQDIDLFIGGLLEKRAKPAIFGETFRCIIGNQFERLKVGDRFFYENRNLVTSFTDKQIRAIRRVRLARVICNNGDNIVRIQKNVFTNNGATVSCDSPAIKDLDLTLWQEAA